MTSPDSFNTLIVGFFLLGMLPMIVIMTTSFTKFSIVLSLLRSALGIQQTPSNLVLAGLSLAATLVVMSPVVMKIGDRLDVETLVEQEQWPRATDLVNAVKEPITEFLYTHTTERDRAFIIASAQRIRHHSGINPDIQPPMGNSLTVLIPAFVISEVSSGFEIGFLLFIAFVAIDLIIANILMSMGMTMFSPTVVSIPVKLLVFVMSSGLTRLMHGLILSYANSP
ncbi:EscR/YscR/HrcR family type III secretion system export apparatus protein [Paraburkholderia hayleyella]|uniref:EscR/YscR/HrcR family type III secretion system export apparatus protein n=1 Tax=Paraburkholderia hayleyella TaxID=2152889 RepID=UPI001290A6A6|nr:EscR/YscR/HrcR family type III secretion system export apparatus protein [Paraburkholderia hayleyella]